MLPSSDKLAHSLNDPQEEALATDGEYSRYYETLGSIGRGAFGFVKMAQHKELPDLMVSELPYGGCGHQVLMVGVQVDTR